MHTVVCNTAVPLMVDDKNSDVFIYYYISETPKLSIYALKWDIVLI